MRKLIIYGAGPQTRQFLTEIEHYGTADPFALTVDREYLKEDRAFGLPVIAFEDLNQFPLEEYDMLVIGSYGRPRLFEKMYVKAREKGYRLINYISPKAMIDVEPVMGDNNIIYSGAFIGYDGRMGSGNIIRQQVYLGHEFYIGDLNVISPGCNIGGQIRMGNRCWIGLGANVRDKITIGDDCTVGMGAAVVRSVESYAVVTGVPAKVVAYQREKGVWL